MHEIINTLENYAHDTASRIISCNDDGIRIRLMIASRGDEEWDLISKDIVHIDMSQYINIMKVEFGGLDLLSKKYIESRNFDYGGESEKYRVIKFTDEDDKTHILVIYDYEVYEKVLK